MFRHERPQRGRLRQFHQVGIEAIGGASPLLDAETILVALDIFRGIGLTKQQVWINSIGCQDCRPAFPRPAARHPEGARRRAVRRLPRPH